MTALQLCASLSAFALFSVVLYRMGLVHRPCLTPRCVARWAAAGVLHGMVAIGVLWWWFDTVADPAASEWHLCLVRMGVAGLMVMDLVRETGRRVRERRQYRDDRGRRHLP